MIPIDLPSFDIKLRKAHDKYQVFDSLRGRYVALTPEEWVRQHFVHYLAHTLGYPTALMGNEIALQCGHKRLRADTVVYNRQAEPIAIIEYKAPDVPITEKVFEQISVYNLLLHVDWLIVSNGIKHYCCKMDYNTNQFVFHADIPRYEQL